MRTIQCLHCGDVFDPEMFHRHIRSIVDNHTSADLAALLERVFDASLLPNPEPMRGKRPSSNKLLRSILEEER